MDSKKWYTSKTLWLNALALAVLIIPVILDAVNATVVNPEAQRLIAVWGGAAMAIINILLRTQTTQTLSR